jgi:hypothetical protein
MSKGKSIKKMFIMVGFWLLFIYVPNLVLSSINGYFSSYILTEINNHLMGHLKMYFD